MFSYVQKKNLINKLNLLRSYKKIIIEEFIKGREIKQQL